MSELDLTNDDVDMLLEAINAWERAPGTEALLSDLMMLMLAPSKEARHETVEEIKLRHQTTQGAEAQQRLEAATMLKAKLFTYRRRSQVR